MLGWILVWLILVVAAFTVRGPMPVDETRYLSAAWEMWQHGNLLVPYLNGEPYSDKPPLLFWLFHVGWGLWGVNEWWPRLVPPLFALANLVMARALARRLWPEQRETAQLVPWILMGSLSWAFFTTTLMFDMLLVFFTLAALHGLVWADQNRGLLGWGLVGIATGLGILTKGPVMLLHIAFPALLGPWWSGRARQRPVLWYLALGGSLLIAAAVALAWALPAAARGGAAYEQAILWHQTTDRLVQSFAHEHPWWWYLPLLPVLLFPWLLWFPLWRGLVSLNRRMDSAVRLCLAWLIPTFLAFSLISGKQFHYLLPLFPAFALLAAHALEEPSRIPGRYAQLPVAIILLLTGTALALLPLLSPLHRQVPWLAETNPLWGIGVILLGLTLLYPFLSVSRSVLALATTTALSVLAIQASAMQAGWSFYNLRPIAHRIAVFQEQGIPVANLGKYHGQYHFLGRLKQPLEIVENDRLQDWARKHPTGRVIVYLRNKGSISLSRPEYEQPYRSGKLQIWSCGDLLTAVPKNL